MIDPEVSEQYDNYFHLFRSKGWKQFIEDMQAIYDGYAIEHIKDEIDLAFVQGERRILNTILNFEVSITQSYESLTEDNYDQTL